MTQSQSWTMAVELIRGKSSLAGVWDSPQIRHYLRQCGFDLTGGISVEQDRTCRTLTDISTGRWWEVRSIPELLNLLS